MRRLRDRSVLRMIATSVALGCLTATAVAGSDIAQEVERAAELLRDGRLVQARSILTGLDRETMTTDERERTLELLAAADRRLRHADPIEVSLQKADVALVEGDVRSAQRHALAARNARGATEEQSAAAMRLLDEADGLKRTLEPVVGGALDQAITDFHDERYGEAKAGLDAVYRSGCKLDPSQLRALDRYREMIVELERERGAPFEITYTPLGLLQPGTVERREDPRPDRGGQAQASASDASQPAPPPPAEASEPQPGDDVFERALRFDAERYLAEADAAFEAGRFSEAAQKYELAAGAYRQHLSPEEAARAEQRLSEARAMLQDRSGDLLGQTIESRSLLRQQATAEYDNLMQQARESLGQGNFEQARANAGRARIAVVDRRDVFSEQELQDRLGRQEALLQQIRNAEEGARQREINERADEVARESQDAAAQQRADKDRRIIEALDRIRQLQLEQKYEEALQVVEQVLFLDPNNAAGLLLKDVLRDVVIYREWNDLQRDKSYSYSRESNRMQRSMVAPEALLSYPDDWPEISFRRGEDLAFVDTEEDRRVLSSLETKRIPATFAANTLEDVLTFVGAVTNLNMDVDWESLSEIGIERDDEITLNLRPVPVKVVLERVLEKISPDEFSRADWAVQDGVLVVASEEGLRRNTFVRIYDVRDLTFQIPNYTEVPDLDLDSVLQQTGNRGGGTQSIFNDPNDAGTDLSESDLLDRLLEIIQTNVDYDGWAANGGETGRLEELNGNLIITNTAKNHRAIVGLLSQLREVRSIQINVEARFLTVAQDFFEQIGFDLDVYFNAQNNQYQEALDQQIFFGGNGSFGNPVPDNVSTLPSDLVGSRTNQTTQWSIEDFDDTTGEVTWEFQPQQFSVTAPDSLSIIPVQQNSFGLTEALLAAGGFAGEVLQSNPAIGVAATFLDDIQVDMLLEATQADRRNVTLTAPRLTFFNGRAANIFVATQRSFVSDLTPIVGTGSVAFDPTIAPLTEGVTLLVRGVTSADRRYVTMTIEARVAQFVEFRSVPVRAQAGGVGDGNGGGQVVESNIEAPTVTISAIETGVTVPDQGTILLGGQSIVTESEIETGVPVLSKLPILNRLFSNRIEVKEEQTLLILLKPTILIQNEEEEQNFPGLLDSLGVGFGAGM